MGKPATRRDRKAALRAQREAEARARARRERRRRFLLLTGAGLAGYALILFLGRAPGAQALPGAAAEAGRAAACTNLELAPQLDGDVPRDHFPTGQATEYPQIPPAAGNHALDPLEPGVRVLDAPPDEARLVHTLEHGSVFLSYRPPGDPDGLGQDAVDALASLAPDRPATYLAPSAALPEGTGLALRAWNVAVLCPGTISAEQATALADGFVTALACTSNAPEGTLGDGC
ncbi:MAG TPA: DUF3105 domain-containing protein [Actinomycetota bacterium]